MKKITLVLLCLLFIFSLTGVGETSYDLEGDTITIGSFWNLEGQYGGDGVFVEWTEYVEEEFNCTIEFTQIPPEEMIDTIISGVMAGDSVADIYIIRHFSIDSLADAGALYPIGDILTAEYYESLPYNHKKLTKDSASFDGRVWGFSINGNANPNQDMFSANGIVWNKKLFEREALPNIYELQEKGEWTWPKFREIAEQATRDTNGDGEIDQWGVQNPPVTQPVMYAYINNGAIYKENNGKMEFTFNKEPALQALNFWQDLIHVDESVNLEVNGFGEIIQEFVNGNIAMLNWDLGALIHLSQTEMEDYGWALLPKAPGADEYRTPLTQNVLGVLPATVNKPEALVELGSALFKTTDNYRDMDKYLDDVTEEFANFVDDYQSIETYEKMFENPFITPHPASPIRGMGQTEFWEQINSVIFEGESPSSAMDAVSPEVQSVLDSTFN